MTRRLVIFDLDYTLTRRGTWGRFVATAMKSKPLLVPVLLTDAAFTQARYKLGLVPRIRVKQRMMAHSIAGWSKTRLTQMADRFADAEVPDQLNPKAFAALRDHQSAGDTILIASAAVDFIVEPLSERLGVENFVATEVSWTDEGCLSMGFSSENCYGEEKLSRIRQWLEESGGPTFDKIIAYSDSRSDAPMLEYADEAIIVCPNRKTRDYAIARGFEIWD